MCEGEGLGTQAQEREERGGGSRGTLARCYTLVHQLAGCVDGGGVFALLGRRSPLRNLNYFIEILSLEKGFRCREG